MSNQGREQARHIGDAFRQQGIVVTQMLSSQWCRCLETSELMDLGPVQAWPPLNSFFRDRSTANSQTAVVQTYLLEQPRQGVLVMVTHQVNGTALTQVVPAAGHAVVLSLGDSGDLRSLGSFNPLE